MRKLLLACCFIVISCGYSIYTPHYKFSLRGKKVCVINFKNLTYIPLVERIAYESFEKRLEMARTFSVVNVAGDCEYGIRGEVVSYRRNIISYGPENLASAYSISIVVNVYVVDMKSGKIAANFRGLSSGSDYRVSGVDSLFDDKLHAIKKAMDDIAYRFVLKVM